MTPLTTDESVALIDKVDGSNASIHDEGVFTWREREFKRLGYAPHEAEHLAATRIDIHEIDKLLRAGCSHVLAWQILIGTRERGIHDPEWDEHTGYNLPSQPIEEDVEDDGA